MKLEKTCPTDYNLLIVQNFWEACYQVLLIILLKEFIKLNVNTNTIIKNVKLEELNINIETALLKIQALTMV